MTNDESKDIPKLTSADGWQSWKQRVLYKILSKSVVAWKIAEGKLAYDESNLDEAGKGIDVIASTLSDDAFQLIQGIINPFEALKVLESEYGVSTETHDRLLSKLDGLRQKEVDPTKYCTEVKLLYKAFEDVGKPIDLAMMTKIIRKGLHDGYKPYLLILDLQLEMIIKGHEAKCRQIHSERAASSAAAASQAAASAESSPQGLSANIAASDTSASLERDEARLRVSLQAARAKGL